MMIVVLDCGGNNGDAGGDDGDGGDGGFNALASAYGDPDYRDLGTSWMVMVPSW